jgi:hypothetical protein
MVGLRCFLSDENMELILRLIGFFKHSFLPNPPTNLIATFKYPNNFQIAFGDPINILSF